LARQDREIYLPGIETRRANAMPNSIPISNRHCRFVDRSFFKCGSLYKGWQPALVSVVAENRKPCPPTKKKKRHQIRSKRNSSKNFRCVPRPLSKIYMVRPSGTWDCRRVRSRTSAGHLLEFQACQGQNQTPGPRADKSGNGSSVHAELEIMKYPVMTLAQNIFKSWRRPAHVNVNARMSVRQAGFRNTKWPHNVRNSVTEALFIFVQHVHPDRLVCNAFLRDFGAHIVGLANVEVRSQESVPHVRVRVLRVVPVVLVDVVPLSAPSFAAHVEPQVAKPRRVRMAPLPFTELPLASSVVFPKHESPVAALSMSVWLHLPPPPFS